MIYIPALIYRELGYTKSKFCLSLFMVICVLVQGEGGRGVGETDRQTETEKNKKSYVIYTEGEREILCDLHRENSNSKTWLV